MELFNNKNFRLYGIISSSSFFVKIDDYFQTEEDALKAKKTFHEWCEKSGYGSVLTTLKEIHPVLYQALDK